MFTYDPVTKKAVVSFEGEILGSIRVFTNSDGSVDVNKTFYVLNNVCRMDDICFESFGEDTFRELNRKILKGFLKGFLEEYETQKRVKGLWAALRTSVMLLGIYRITVNERYAPGGKGYEEAKEDFYNH